MVLALVCMLGLAGCTSNTNRATEPDSAISACIGNDVTSIKITHVLSGQSTEWRVKGDEIKPLQTWFNGLEYEIAEFEKGNTPGDTEGGETYSFELTGGAYPELVYIIHGPDTCIVLSLELRLTGTFGALE